VASVITFEALEDEDLDAWIARHKVRHGDGRSIRCARCARQITSANQRTDRNGAHAHRFENPAGFIFRIGCFKTAPGCRTVGEATLEWTWFAGHPWSMALCIQCGAHLGWHYGPGSTGDGFYGLILDRLSENL
jgi:hypothetical protein